MVRRYNLASLISEPITEFTFKYSFEVIKNTEGIIFINDSNSVNLNRTWYSLARLPKEKNVILVLGDARTDFKVIEQEVKDKVKIIICLGVVNIYLHKWLSKYVDMIITENSMEGCVKQCNSLVRRGEVVLFSPGVSSYGMFEDYRERGAQFENNLIRLI